MPALPHSIPHDEWEIHTRSLHGFVEELSRRVRRLEEHGLVPGSLGAARKARELIAASPAAAAARLLVAATPGGSEQKQLAARSPRPAGHERSWPHSAELSSQLVELHRVAREDLASQRGLEATSARLDLHLEVERRQTEKGLEDLKSFTLSSIQTLREELSGELSEFCDVLKKATQDISGLTVALEAHARIAEATFVSKADHVEACKSFKDEHSASTEALRSLAMELEASNASREELSELQGTLGAAVHELDSRHCGTRQLLDETTNSLDALRSFCDTTYATLESMVVATQCIEDIRADLGSAAADRQVLHAACDTSRGRLDEAEKRLSDYALKFGELDKRTAESDELCQLARREAQRRCQEVEAGLKGPLRTTANDPCHAAARQNKYEVLDRRERSSWEQFALERR
mmetsp:Transcript_125508/g.401943  ORF Transcript_125508/g.401943 Transcript_125508/m.401943 type:complete len:408 (-) Transcript_125508:29-1252(-)